MHPLIADPLRQKTSSTWELSRSLRSISSTDIVVVAGDPEAQLGYLPETERRIADPFSIPVDMTENKDSLIHACSDHRLFLAKVKLFH